MEVDSLIISLGLDPEGLKQGILKSENLLQTLLDNSEDFIAGLREGMQEALEEAAQGGGQVAQAVNEAGKQAENAGNKFQEAGKNGGKGMKDLADKTKEVGDRASETAAKLQSMGRQWGGFIKGIITNFAAPFIGAISVGSMFGSYIDDVAKVAEETGRYTSQMEDAAKKKELLSRINKEDIELYRKGKLALLDFNFAMSRLSTSVMRALSPAIRKGIEILKDFSGWVERNQPNIIRFFTVLAATITAVLTPAFIRMGAAMLMNPLTWIIGGILLLAAVIDDLVTYIQGGESEFESFWSQFGTGEEILASLKSVWESVLAAFNSVKDYLPYLAGAAAGIVAVAGAFKAWSGISSLISGVMGAVKALGVAMAANPIGATIMLIAAVMGALVPLIIKNWDSIKEAFGAAADWIKDIWNDFVGWILDKAGMIGSAVKKVLGFFGFGGGEEKKGKDVVSQEYNKATKAGASSGIAAGMADPLGLGNYGVSVVPETTSEMQSNISEQLAKIQASLPPTNAQLTAAAVPVQSTVNNDKTVNIDSKNNFTFNMQSGDPNAVASAVGGALQQSNANLGALASDGGVRQ